MHQFAVGTRFKWHIYQYEVCELVADGQLRLMQLETGKFHTVITTILVDAFFAGQLHFTGTAKSASDVVQAKTERPQTLADVTPMQQLTARYRYWVIQPVVALPPNQRTRADAERRVVDVRQQIADAQLPVQTNYDDEQTGQIRTAVSVTSFYAWLKRYEQSGNDIRSLIPHWQQRGRRKFIAADVEEIITDVLNELYLQREKHSLDDIVLEVHLRIDEANAAQPERELSKPHVPPSTTVLSNWMRPSGYGHGGENGLLVNPEPNIAKWMRQIGHCRVSR